MTFSSESFVIYSITILVAYMLKKKNESQMISPPLISNRSSYPLAKDLITQERSLRYQTLWLS